MRPRLSFRRVWSDLALIDRWMVSLRGVALVGGIGWWALAPLEPESRRQLLGLFGAFAAYSGMLYAIHARHPDRLRQLYRVAMALDLVFIFFLVRATGGIDSPFSLAFHLLIALHGFYFGLKTGVGVALAASALYLAADLGPSSVPVSDVGLRVGFFLLVGICMGGLAERERREHRLVEQLNTVLSAQQERLREAQEHLVRSERLATIGELAAGLAHDLRNPLAGVSGALHVLSGQLTTGGHRDLLSEVQTQIGRMNKTLTDLLAHARPAAPQCLPLDINALVEQSLWFLPMAAESRIEITRELEPNLPVLRLDPNLLHQALLNILINARQAMPRGGRLVVRTRLSQIGTDGPEWVEVVVADTGNGIAPEHRPHIFQPFFTTKARGTGLGLAIAARIIEQHGGRIAVDSVPGNGATFRVSLPVPGGADPRGGLDDAREASHR